MTSDGSPSEIDLRRITQPRSASELIECHDGCLLPHVRSGSGSWSADLRFGVGVRVAGLVEVVKGDMFDGACDMVVVPCPGIPTVSWFVADRLKAFNIAPPRDPIPLGEVVYCPLAGAEQIAQTVAYAASVMPNGGTTVDALKSVGTSIGIYAIENRWAQLISCPLLGSGAGGIDPLVAAASLSEGFLSSAPDGARLRLFVLDDIHCGTIQTGLVAGPSEVGEAVERPDRPLRVFLSYTNSSDSHAAFVKSVGQYLRDHGVDAPLDVWNLRPGMDLTQWMCNELDLADRVLLFCDPLYAQKADRRHGGVGWEIRIVQGDLLQSQSDNLDKYIPIVVTDELGAASVVPEVGVQLALADLSADDRRPVGATSSSGVPCL